MKPKFLNTTKSGKILKPIRAVKSINDISVTGKMVHTGVLLSTDYILKNRCSKYDFIKFE